MKWNKNGETVIENDDDLETIYLDWKNNFLTIPRFAAYYGWSEEHAKQVIVEGRQLMLES